MRLPDLDFAEKAAAPLRDEIKRLRETELAIADDPMAREVELEKALLRGGPKVATMRAARCIAWLRMTKAASLCSRSHRSTTVGTGNGCWRKPRHDGPRFRQPRKAGSARTRWMK